MIRFLIIINIILYFITGFSIPLITVIPCYIISSSLLLTTLFLKPNLLLANLKSLLKVPTFKLLLILFVWIFIGILVSFFTGKFYPAGFFSAFIGGIIFSVLIPYFIGFTVLKNYFSLKNMVKILFIMFFVTCVYGLIELVVFYFQISFLEDIFKFISNRMVLVADISVKGVMAFGLPRISSFFLEPSFFAYFLMIISPIIFSVGLCKKKLFENKFYNLIFVKALMFLSIICILLTQSPIFILLSFIFTTLFLTKGLIKKNKDALFILINASITILVFGFIFKDNIQAFIFSGDLENTFLSRIITSVESFGSFEDFLLKEQSLATRVVLFLNYFIIFLKNPIFGIGYGNLTKETVQQLAVSPLPLTWELNYRIVNDAYEVGGCSSIIFRLFAETGLVGPIIVCLILLLLIRKLHKGIKFYPIQERYFLNGLKYTLVIILITSFYDSNFNNPLIWFLIAIADIVTRDTQNNKNQVT